MSPINTAIEAAEPFDGGPYQTESGWTTTFSLALSNGCIDRGNGLQVYTDADGKQVKVTAGRYFIRGHIYTLASDKTIPVAAHPSGLGRLDTVVVRLDTVNKQVYADILTGVVPTSGSPVPQTLTQVPGGVWEEPLADVSTAAGFTVIAPTDITDRRNLAGSGTNWTDFTPVVYTTTGSVPAINAHSQNHARYRIDGSTCRVSWKQSITCSGTATLSYGAKLPIAARYTSVTGASLVQDYPAGFCYIQPNSVGGASPGSANGLIVLQKANGFNLTTGTAFFDSFDIEYEIAPGAVVS